ncbi:ribonuclease HII [Curtobacterium sp. MCSS17_008]|uniref:ribonuclease HII n=1 Tax=Curtobacterium sp. MCSS17_008 TaxID=2175647 RepID=UPI000DA90BB7|nr:ribonuclease HII [Curtobacterium sp. MCSS17_008]PZF54982.1 ribonuclease HII [Curtobacterium sp. MCSS17_008]
MSAVRPSLRVEKKLLSAGRVTVIGMDEVGRGAIAGPVAVGVAAVTVDVGRVPQGLADSKLLSAARRTELVPVVRRWARTAVGMATAQVVDEQGIVPALGQAGAAALGALVQDGLSLDGAVVVLDGSFDWLSRAVPGELTRALGPLDVVVRVKADRDCASVAAASVVAKVERDALMVAAHDDAPHYAWASNKGYGSAAHYDGIRAVGAHTLHRKSWLHQASSVALDGFDALEGLPAAG